MALSTPTDSAGIVGCRAFWFCLKAYRALMARMLSSEALESMAPGDYEPA
jgi:hypothetical protein